MKKVSLILLVLPTVFLAASPLPRHQAYGQLRFGIPASAAAAGLAQITHVNPTGPHTLMAADARNNFVTSGSIRSPKDVAFEHACQIHISLAAEPFLSVVTVSSEAKTADAYDSFVKKAWEDFQDIGDSKFQRRGIKGAFPTIEAVQHEKEQLITDTWEVDGIRIQLSVRYYDPAQRPNAPPGPVRYRVALTATEISPPLAK